MDRCSWSFGGAHLQPTLSQSIPSVIVAIFSPIQVAHIHEEKARSSVGGSRP